MEPFFSITATDPEGKYQQILQLILRIMEETLAGTRVGDVFATDESDIFTISLSATGGLEKSSAQVQIKLKTGTILSTDAGGLDIDESGLFTEIDNRIDATAGFESATELTIATGEVTVSGSQKHRHHKIIIENTGVDTTDALTKINGGSVGDMMLIRPNSDSETVVVTTGTDILCPPTFTMESISDNMLLYCYATDVWHEITRKSNA